MKLLQKIKIKNNNLNTELTEMGVFSAVAGNQLPNQLQKRVLPALFHLRCPSQSHQRSARGRTRLTTVTSISCRSFQRQLLYLTYFSIGGGQSKPLLPLFYRFLRRGAVSQGLFCPYYTDFCVGGGQSRGQTEVPQDFGSTPPYRASTKVCSPFI